MSTVEAAHHRVRQLGRPGQRPLPPRRKMPSSRIPQRGRQQLDHRDDGGTAERVHAPDNVREHAQSQDDRGPAPVPALANGTGEQPEEEDGQGQAERVRVLPGQRREEVPPVDGERVVEEERQGGRGHDRRDRGAQPEEAAAGPGADRQDERPENGAQLERDVVGDDPAADGDEEVGDGEVEGVERESVVPAGVPPGDVPVAQQRLEVLGHGDVRARVAAGGRRVGEEQARVELPNGDRHHRSRW